MSIPAKRPAGCGKIELDSSRQTLLAGCRRGFLTARGAIGNRGYVSKAPARSCAASSKA
jgi:hypothetical protein